MIFTKRQEEIIEASKELIGEKGIQNLTMKNLSNKMNFSEPALYRHFKDKTEILQALLLFHKEKIISKVNEIHESKLNALEKLEKIFEFKFSHIEKNPALIMVIFSETSFQYCSVLSKIVQKILQQRTKKINELIELGQKEGTIRTDLNSEQLSTIILGGIRDTVLSWKLSGFKTDLKEDGRKLWATFAILLNKNN